MTGQKGPQGRGRIRIVQGDCLKVLRRMPDASVDIVVTSPPYNQLGKSRIPKQASGMFVNDAWMKKVRRVGYADDMPENEYQAWLRIVVQECLRVSKGLVWINHKVRYRDREGIHPMRMLGFPLYAEIIWDRRQTISFNCRRPAPSHEGLWAFGTPHYWDRVHDNRMSVWQITPQRGIKDHPCPYPVELAKRPIESSCPPGGLVLDPFCGSGSTGIACDIAGRAFLGIDKELRFCKLSRKRIADARRERRAAARSALKVASASAPPK